MVPEKTQKKIVRVKKFADSASLYIKMRNTHELCCRLNAGSDMKKLEAIDSKIASRIGRI